jgi:CBS domain-containing protein
MITNSVSSVIKAKKLQEIVSVQPGATVADAVGLMVKRDLGAIVVRDAAGTVLGIFTERDLMRRVVDERREPKATVISSVMSPNVRHVPGEATIEEALRLMVVHGYRHLLVEEKDQPLGLVSIRDLMGALVLPDEPIASEGRVGVIRSRAEDAVRSIQHSGER